MEIYIRLRTWCKVMWKWYANEFNVYKWCVYANVNFSDWNLFNLFWKRSWGAPFNRTSNEFILDLNNVQIIKWLKSLLRSSTITHSFLCLLAVNEELAIDLCESRNSIQIWAVFVIYVALQCFHNTFVSS